MIGKVRYARYDGIVRCDKLTMPETVEFANEYPSSRSTLDVFGVVLVMDDAMGNLGGARSRVARKFPVSDWLGFLISHDKVLPPASTFIHPTSKAYDCYHRYLHCRVK